MKKRFAAKAVDVFTGKYGVLLLTLLHMCLALLIVTLADDWKHLDISYIKTDFMSRYVLDFRVGFVSRALIGSILYLFTKKLTLRMVSTMLIVIVMIVTALFALLQALLANKALRTKDYSTLLLSYLFFLNVVFWCDTYYFFGLLDNFLILLLQIWLLCTERNRTLGFWLAPIVCFIGLLIHTAFFSVCVPVMGAVLWFELLRNEKPGRVKIVLFALTCILAAGLFVYFSIFAQNAVRIDADTLLQMTRAKYDGEMDENYFLFYLYQNTAGYSADSPIDFLKTMHSFVSFNSAATRRNFLNAAPPTVLFFCGCVYHAKKHGGRKLAYLGMVAPLVALFPNLNISTDEIRFFSMFLTTEYMLLQYIASQTEGFFLPCMDSPPSVKMSAYALNRRRKRISVVVAAAAVLGAVYIVRGFFIL